MRNYQYERKAELVAELQESKQQRRRISAVSNFEVDVEFVFDATTYANLCHRFSSITMKCSARVNKS